MQKYSKTLLGSAVFIVGQMMVLPQVWAGPCTVDSDAQAQANNIECTATRTEYTAGSYALHATGGLAHLKVPGAATLNPSGTSITATNRGVAHAERGGEITVGGTLDVLQYGRNNSYGVLASGVDSKVVINGDLSVDMKSNGGGTRRAVLALSGGSIEVFGKISVKATEVGFTSPRGLATEGDSSSLFYTDALVDLREVNAMGAYGGNAWGVRANSTDGQVAGAGNTEILVSGGGIGYRAGGGANRVDGVLTSTVEDGSPTSSAVQVYSNGTLRVGANSSFSNQNGRGLSLELDSSSSESAFAAGAGLEIKALQGIVFQSSDARVNRTSLQNANIEAAQEIWSALGNIQAEFDGSAGRYTGASALDATAKLYINLTDGAVWDLQGNSTFTSLVLSSNANLSSGGATHTVTGELTNTSGVLDLQGSAFSAGDVLTVVGNYNGGGTLLIDTVLGDGTSPTDKLVVNGNVTGTTTIQIKNIGGVGAETGESGILVAEATGSIPHGAFQLAAPIRAGDYSYELVQNGNKVYLQSKFDLVGPEPGPVSAIGVPTLSWLSLLGLSLLLAGFGVRAGRNKKS